MNAAIMRRLSPIAPAAVGDMRHSLHPEQGNQAAVDSVPAADKPMMPEPPPEP
jgi:hypothetical protein